MNPLTTASQQVAERTEPENNIDWERAFKVLASSCCAGFVQSTDVADKVELLNEHADPRAGDYLAKLFNKSRSNWMQEFMG
jgi:hypothetical protein